MLTGNKNLDFKILNKLDDVDLVKVCQTNREANELCNNQTFWFNRIRLKFPYLNLDLLRQYKGDRDWSEYYINDLRNITPLNAQDILYEIVTVGRLDLVIIAVNNGADIRADDDVVIREATYNGHLDIVKYLVRLGADIESNKNESIVLASYYGHLDMVKYLVENGADIRASDDEAVIMANAKGHLHVVEYLVGLGAPDPRN